MRQRILCPLDGSEMSEAALAPTAYLAGVFGAGVTLAHLVEPSPPASIHGQRHLTGGDEAERYLAATAERVFGPDWRRKCRVRVVSAADVARGIDAFRDQDPAPDLVVMSVHGRRGVRALLAGNIAQQVIGLGRLPVLLVRSDHRAPAEFACRRLLIPTDGDPAHEEGVAAACELAKATGAAAKLLFVVPTAGILWGRRAASQLFMPAATSASLEITEEHAREYLARTLLALEKAGLANVSAEIAHGDPARMIAKIADKFDADAIALATHGRAGTAGFWTHSVGPKLATRTRRPLFLVPVRRD